MMTGHHSSNQHPDSIGNGRLSRRTMLGGAVGATLSVGPLGSLLAACGSESGSGASDQVTLWHGWTGGVNTKSLHEIIEQFNESSKSGLTVKPTALPWDDLFSKLTVSAASGKAPNVVLYHQSEIAEFASRGVTKPIDDLVADAGIEMKGAPPEISAAAKWEDKTHAVPVDLHPLGMYYNVDLAKKAGLDPAKPPTTRDDLLGWATELTSASEAVYGIHIPYTGSGPRWLWWSFLHQNGGQFIGPNGENELDSDASKEALQFIVDLFHKHKVARPEVKEESDPVARKRAAIWFTGPWAVTQRLEQKIPFRTAVLPVIGDKQAAWANAHAMAMPKQRDDSNDEASIEVIAWLFNNYALPAKQVGIIPLAEEVRTGSEFTGDRRHQYYQPFIDELPDIALEPSVSKYTEIFSFSKPTPMTTSLDAALSRSKTVSEALAEMKIGVDEQLQT